MLWVSASARGNDTADALRSCISDIKEKRKRARLRTITDAKGDAGKVGTPGEDVVDLCIVHFSDEHLSQLDFIKNSLRQILEPRVLLGNYTNNTSLSKSPWYSTAFD